MTNVIRVFAETSMVSEHGQLDGGLSSRMPYFDQSAIHINPEVCDAFPTAYVFRPLTAFRPICSFISTFTSTRGSIYG